MLCFGALKDESEYCFLACDTMWLCTDFQSLQHEGRARGHRQQAAHKIRSTLTRLHGVNPEKH
jgi:hypothetical protein